MDSADLQDEGRRSVYTGKEDVRKIDVGLVGTTLIANAYYPDGSKVDDFRGYWYGWQVVPKGMVWTPLGINQSSIEKPVGPVFTEIHVYKYEQKGKEHNPMNTRGIWTPHG